MESVTSWGGQVEVSSRWESIVTDRGGSLLGYVCMTLVNNVQVNSFVTNRQHEIYKKVNIIIMFHFIWDF